MGVANAAVGNDLPHASMSIGAVLEQLRGEFPDVTISKIRFLEEQGLVEPRRSRSGYRQFSPQDVERLRYVLAAQRDHYLPLRVIREHLAAMDRGQSPATDPAPSGGEPPRPAPRLVPEPSPSRREPGDRFTRAEVLARAGCGEELLAELESYGLIGPRAPGEFYDAEAVAIATAASQLSGFGIEPRHLRPLRNAADHQAALVEQVAAPLRRQRGREGRDRAGEAVREVAGLCLELQGALLSAALDRAGS